MTIKDNVAYITNRIEEAIDHPKLNRYIEKPYIDQDYIHVLSSMFAENGTYQHIEDYIASISLVHLALNMHDQIRLQRAETDHERKLRQLTVLAGDYYSSQYYQLLAKRSDFSMIKSLSNAIQKINEFKTRFFYEDLSIQKRFDLIRWVESTLLTNVTKTLHLPNWESFVSDYFFVKRLIIDKQNLLRNETTKFFQHVTDRDPNYRISFLHEVDQRIEEGRQKLERYDLKVFPFIKKLTHSTLFRSEKDGVSLIAEEG